MALQMKLLRVLQEREFERIGDTRTIKVDVRVVAATNADLARMVKEGTFREDLYYRLNVIAVQLAPLRERAEDIPLLVQRFIEKFWKDRLPDPGSPRADSRGARIPTVSQEAMRRLMSFHWPGNVRQLENAIERAIAMLGGRDQIEVADLPPDLHAAVEDPGLPSLDLPARALARTDNNKGAAARLLGLKRTTLVEKLKRFGDGT
jgi:transcriptional regulator with PAS, ATPase and Fis domain